MQTHTFKTPNGYEVTINTSLTYRQSMELQRITMGQSNFNISPGSTKPEEMAMQFSAAAMLDANEQAIKFLVVKVVDSEGTEQSNPAEAVLDMPSDDGQAVMSEIDSVTRPKGRS